MRAAAYRSVLPHTASALACRLIGTLRLVALVVFCVAFPTVLDISSFLVDCRWTYMSQGLPVTHVHFTEQSVSVCVSP